MGLKKPLSAKRHRPHQRQHRTSDYSEQWWSVNALGCTLHPVKIFQVCVPTHTQIHIHTHTLLAVYMCIIRYKSKYFKNEIKYVEHYIIHAPIIFLLFVLVRRWSSWHQHASLWGAVVIPQALGPDCLRSGPGPTQQGDLGPVLHTQTPA